LNRSRFSSHSKTPNNNTHRPCPLLSHNKDTMSQQQPPSPSQEGKVTATQVDIDKKQEELDVELQEVRLYGNIR
jgi:hypothetical protein